MSEYLYQNPKLHNLLHVLVNTSCPQAQKQTAVDSFFTDQTVMNQLNKELNIRTRKKAPALYQKLVERGDTYFIGEAYEYFTGLTNYEKIKGNNIDKIISGLKDNKEESLSLLSQWIIAKLSDISSTVILNNRNAITQVTTPIDGGLKTYRYTRNQKMLQTFAQNPFDEKKVQCLFLEHDEVYQELYHDCRANNLFEPVKGVVPDSVSFKAGLYQYLKDGYQTLEKPIFDELVYGYMKSITRHGDITRVKRIIDIDKDTINAPLSSNRNIIPLDDPLKTPQDSELADQTDMFTAQRVAFLQDLNMVMTAAPMLRRKALIELYGGIRQASEIENNLQVIQGYLTAELKTDAGINDLSKVTGLERRTVSRIFNSIMDGGKSSLVNGLTDQTVETSRDAVRLIRSQMFELLKEYKVDRKLKAAQVTAIPIKGSQTNNSKPSLREI